MSGTVVGLFTHLGDAGHAVLELEAAGFARDQISIAHQGSAAEGAIFHDRPTTEGPADTNGDESGTGAAAGGALGAGLGLFAGMGLMAVPGFGPVAAVGPVMAAVLGAGVGGASGAVAGGLYGGLVHSGIEGHRAEQYADRVGQGETLLVVHCDDTCSDRAARIVAEAGAYRVEGPQGSQHGAAPPAEHGAAASSALPPTQRLPETGHRDVTPDGEAITRSITEEQYAADPASTNQPGRLDGF